MANKQDLKTEVEKRPRYEYSDPEEESEEEENEEEVEEQEWWEVRDEEVRNDEDREFKRRRMMFMEREKRNGHVWEDENTMTLKCTNTECKEKRQLSGIAIQPGCGVDRKWATDQGFFHCECNDCDAVCCSDCIRTLDGVKNTTSLEHYIAKPTTVHWCPTCYEENVPYDSSDESDYE